MKLFVAAALAIAMSTGIVVAQETGSTQDSEGDATTYLQGPKVNELYTDESRTAVRPPDEFKEVWSRMNPADQEDIRRACTANRDVRYNPLCTNVASM